MSFTRTDVVLAAMVAHGSPFTTEQLRKLMEAETHIVLAAANQGDVERLATVLREYQIPYRIGSRAVHASSETLLEEANGDAEYDAAALRSALEERDGLRRGLGPSIYTQLNHLLPFSRNDYWELSELKQRLDRG